MERSSPSTNGGEGGGLYSLLGRPDPLRPVRLCTCAGHSSGLCAEAFATVLSTGPTASHYTQRLPGRKCTQFGRESTSGPQPSQVDYPAGVREIRLAMTREQTPIPNILCRSSPGRSLSIESRRKQAMFVCSRRLLSAPVVIIESRPLESWTSSFGWPQEWRRCRLQEFHQYGG
jgi:hypothetical protein